MTRVLHVITGLDRGGAERQLVLLLRRLPVDCEVAVLTRGGALAGELDVPVHEIGMRGNRDVAALPRLVRLIRDGRYDAVHTHLYRACVYGRIAARTARIPTIIATEHSLGDGHIEGRRTSAGVRLLYRATERLGSTTVAVSPTVERRLREWGVRPERLVTIPNVMDPDAFAFSRDRRLAVRAALGIGPEERAVGAVGRLVPTKRFDLLLEAFAKARGRPSGTRLVIAGDGPSRADLERRAADLGVDGRTVFTGATADVPGVLAAVDVFAAPSTQEAFGLGVLEALAAGLPVLYTACPAVEDLPDGMAGPARRVPSRVDAWSAALDEHFAHEPRRHEPPPAVAAYSVQEAVARLTDLYTTVKGPA